MLDDRALPKVGGATMIGFWIGVAVVMFRRPHDPSPRDLLYIRWGYPAMLILVLVCLPLTGVLRG
ncbi:MAG TPA: hypothetical protein VGN72_01600 [Tepidisphaeraceae bacterium]|nr:hypothetical protein [Tepidisphaeraceae bacterium]